MASLQQVLKVTLIFVDWRRSARHKDFQHFSMAFPRLCCGAERSHTAPSSAEYCHRLKCATFRKLISKCLRIKTFMKTMFSKESLFVSALILRTREREEYLNGHSVSMLVSCILSNNPLPTHRSRCITKNAAQMFMSPLHSIMTFVRSFVRCNSRVHQLRNQA